MIAAIILLFIYCLFLSLALANKKLYLTSYKFYHQCLFIGLLLVFVIIFRGEWLPDYTPYCEAFYHGDSRLEIMWGIIRSLTLWTGSPHALFGIYGAIAVFFTLSGIFRQSKTIVFSILVWLSYLYIIQDMIQIRQGVASALFFYSIRFITEKRWKPFIALNLIGATFHVSAIAVLPLYFINTQKLQSKFYLFLIPLSYCLYFFKLGIVYLIQFIPIDFIQFLWETKSQTLDVTAGVLLFNFRQIAMVSICIFLWFHIKRILAFYPSCIVHLKIFTIAIAVFILLFDVPDIASRINVIYTSAEIIAIPAAMYAFKRLNLGKLAVAGISVIFFFTYYSRFVLP